MALADFLFRGEFHYAIEEVLSKNTCGLLAVLSLAWDNWRNCAPTAAGRTCLNLPSLRPVRQPPACVHVLYDVG